MTDTFTGTAEEQLFMRSTKRFLDDVAVEGNWPLPPINATQFVYISAATSALYLTKSKQNGLASAS